RADRAAGRGEILAQPAVSCELAPPGRGMAAGFRQYQGRDFRFPSGCAGYPRDPRHVAGQCPPGGADHRGAGRRRQRLDGVMGRVLDYPPVWLAMFAGAAWLSGRLWPLPVATGAGWLLVLAGLALMGASGWVMLRAGATVDPTRAPTALVTHGPYRLSRNPIYLADAVILAGL